MEVKEGNKTSELAVTKKAIWVSLVIALGSLAYGLLQNSTSPWAIATCLIISTVGAVLSACGYTAARVLIKHQAIKSDASAKVDLGEIVGLIMDAIGSAKKEDKADASAGESAGATGNGLSGVGQ